MDPLPPLGFVGVFSPFFLLVVCCFLEAEGECVLSFFLVGWCPFVGLYLLLWVYPLCYDSCIPVGVSRGGMQMGGGGLLFPCFVVFSVSVCFAFLFFFLCDRKREKDSAVVGVHPRAWGLKDAIAQ